MRSPAWVSLEPLREWPRTPTPSAARTYAQFKSSDSDTWALLGSEIEKLIPRRSTLEARLLMAYTPAQLTVDGSRPRAGEQPAHPGVVILFETADGEQRYAADAYVRPGDNLRAIAKTLEALRAIGRWKATDGEQYRGFLAIESGIAAGAGAPFHNATGAKLWLVDLLDGLGIAADLSDEPATLIRKAQRHTHPDAGGNAEQFRLVTVASEYLNRGTK